MRSKMCKCLYQMLGFKVRDDELILGSVLELDLSPLHRNRLPNLQNQLQHLLQ
jgi:hypothetical protein